MTRQDNEVAAGAIVEDGAWLAELRRELSGLLAGVFAQARSRLTAFAYIGALLAEPGDRRSCWQLAEAAGHATPRRMQALLAGHAWDWAAALAALQRFIVARLGDPGAIVVLDETAELKKGQASVILSFAVDHGCDLGFSVVDDVLNVAVAVRWGPGLRA